MDKLTQLESVLLSLGRLELAAEKALETLSIEGRQSALAGDYEGADLAWSKHDRTKQNLLTLRERIQIIESKLYAARRKIQK